MTRETLPARRACWRQKVVIRDAVSGRQAFFVDFGEHADGRLAEIFIVASKAGTFVRGTLDALARQTSLALQQGTPPSEVAKTLLGLDYPPQGPVEAEGSSVRHCTSIADYLGQEIRASYCRGEEEVPAAAGGGDPPPPPPPAPAADGPAVSPWHRELAQRLADESGEAAYVLDRTLDVLGRVERTLASVTLEGQATAWERQNALLVVRPAKNGEASP